jgi:hypothetical protein
MWLSALHWCLALRCLCGDSVAPARVRKTVVVPPRQQRASSWALHSNTNWTASALELCIAAMVYHAIIFCGRPQAAPQLPCHTRPGPHAVTNAGLVPCAMQGRAAGAVHSRPQS